MKLYTEEQIRKALDFFLTDENKKSQVIETLTHIELPSDKEIEKQSEWLDNPLERLSWRDGAKWMRDKIQGGEQ